MSIVKAWLSVPLRELTLKSDCSTTVLTVEPLLLVLCATQITVFPPVSKPPLVSKSVLVPLDSNISQ